MSAGYYGLRREQHEREAAEEAYTAVTADLFRREGDRIIAEIHDRVEKARIEDIERETEIERARIDSLERETEALREETEALREETEALEPERGERVDIREEQNE